MRARTLHGSGRRQLRARVNLRHGRILPASLAESKSRRAPRLTCYEAPSTALVPRVGPPAMVNVAIAVRV